MSRGEAQSNAVIAGVLSKLSTALKLSGEDRFKVKAYRNAAQTIAAMTESVAALIEKGSDLTEIPGIGKGISGVIREIVAKGTVQKLEKASAAIPLGLAEFSDLPLLDPDKVQRIYKKLGISSIRELRSRLDSGEIGAVLGSRLEEHVRRGLSDRPRMLLYEAERVAERVLKFLQSQKKYSQVQTTGSLRRMQDTVGDLAFVVATDDAAGLFREFRKFALTEGGLESAAEARYRLATGELIRLFSCDEQDCAFELLCRTGSEKHLRQLRTFAKSLKKPFSRNAFRSNSKVAMTEAGIYSVLGLDFILPELREGRGEIDAAVNHKLPKLITVAALKGDLHMHTNASDGAATLIEMARAGKERGYEYIGISDHSQSLKITNGLSEKRLLAQMRAIDKLNAKLSGIRTLKSAEVDIREDGSLDYRDEILRELDYTICSIHSRFRLNKRKQTERLIRAMDNRYCNIIGHATGRLLLKRPPYDLDFPRLVTAAQERGCFFEINSSPDRLDLSDEHALLALRKRVKIAISTDAHSVEELDFVNCGVKQARRAWLGPGDVLNTLSLEKLLRALKR